MTGTALWRQLAGHRWVQCPHCGFSAPQLRKSGTMECPACGHTSGLEPEERTEPMAKPMTLEDVEKNIQLPVIVKRQARMQALRLREKEALNKSGKWQHWLYLPLADIVLKLRASVEELLELACVPIEGKMSAAQLGEFCLRLLKQGADVANWAMFFVYRVIGGDRLEKTGEVKE